MELRHATLDHLDTSDQLFNEWDEAGFITEAAERAKARTVKGVGREAVSHAFVEQNTAPRSFLIEDVIGDIARKREAERDDAYGDLGGGTRQPEYGRNRYFLEALDGYEPWHDETRRAVEQFRLYDMTSTAFDAMTQEDKRRFSLQAFSFLDTVKKLHHFINMNNGDMMYNSFLANRFGDSQHSEAELRSYSHILAQLAKGVDETGVADKIREEAGVPPETWSSYHKKRAEAIKRATGDIRRHGAVELVHDREKFRIKRS